MSTLTYSCPNCGAHIKHEITTQEFHCEYCTSDFSLEQVKEHALKKQKENVESARKDYQTENKDIDANGFQEVAIRFVCKQCGAEVISDKNTVSTFCLYCHSPNIMQSRLIEEYSPDKVLPFQINEEAAKTMFKQWVNKVKYLPDGFASEDRLQKISGLYAPFWLYDTACSFRFTGIGKSIQTTQLGRVVTKKTDRYEFVREGTLSYNSVPVDASISLNDEEMICLEPYDYSKMKDFDMAYLSGYYAEKYDNNKDELYPKLESELRDYGNGEISKLVHQYDHYDSKVRELEIQQQKVSYTFLPIWFLNYQMAGKDYAFTMNGQSGSVVGVLPIDKKKRRKQMFQIAGVLFLIGFIGLFMTVVTR